MAYRRLQSKRGQEAVDMVRKLLENKYGVLSGVSMNETKYSVGVHGKPDLIFREFAIEVKRIEFLSYTEATLKINHKSWNRLRAWSHLNKKILVLVIVVTRVKYGYPAYFYIFTEDQINKLQKTQVDKIWFGARLTEILLYNDPWDGNLTPFKQHIEDEK